MNMNENNKSLHILNTSSNLLGLCFVVLTFIKIQNLQAATLIDDVTTVAIIFFMTSSIFSFLFFHFAAQQNKVCSMKTLPTMLFSLVYF